MVRRLGRSATLRGSGEAAVTGISQDSRLVRAGDVYAALPGRHRHGIEFAVEAAARGAVAMLSDRGSDVLPTARGVDLDSAVGGLENLDTVPGRLEAVDAGQPFSRSSTTCTTRPVSDVCFRTSAP
ncbi:Mur ligase domain-containing protein [Rhodococcus opacus]|uniref:Mur ligase domain-containing protein n=2 Tax=Nocardiaceae TaxID=85025 RepID=UPI00211E037C|nr:Mur ligase domain-containing protein [Rhodococcus opacus]